MKPSYKVYLEHYGIMISEEKVKDLMECRWAKIGFAVPCAPGIGMIIKDDDGNELWYRSLEVGLRELMCWPTAKWLQNTRQVDKNNKVIYEGDILLFETHYSTSGTIVNNKPEKKVVEFVYAGWEPFDEKDYDNCDMYDPEMCEVIGNIYENPDLMEDE